MFGDEAVDGGLQVDDRAEHAALQAPPGELGEEAMKVIRAENCSALVANHVYLKYPASQKEGYDSIVRRMAKSLTSEPGMACD